MWRSSTPAKEYQIDDELKYSHHRPNQPSVTQISTRLLYIFVGCLALGVLLIFINVLQLRSLNNAVYTGGVISADSSYNQRPIAWICAKNINSGYLRHVFTVFNRVGYVTTENVGTRWDVLWSHEYPFGLKEIGSALTQIHSHQKINHFPGSGFICNKASLAVSHFAFHPIAFEIPKDKEKFLEEVKKFPNKMWVEKSNSHRGIRIKTSAEIKVDGTASNTFVEEFISNPYLIDNRKFDIGIYVVLTSINPLRVYIFENEILIRFCIKDYRPLDEKNELQYVVGDEYTQPWELQSLKHMWKQGKFSRKEMILTHIKNEGKDGDKVWQDMLDAIREVYIKKEVDFISSTSAFGSTSNFFELVRFDFILDEDMKVWLMEVNMSPNLSSASHSVNSNMYEQVIFNLFGLVGVANKLGHSNQLSSENEKDMLVGDYNIVTSYVSCASQECKHSCINKMCQMCHSCLTVRQRSFIKAAFYEHTNRGGYRRVFPAPTTKEKARGQQAHHLSSSNELMDGWFRNMCIKDASWCQ